MAGDAYVGLCLLVGAALYQQRNARYVAFARGKVQRRPAFLRA
jgi:hypothetical protein